MKKIYNCILILLTAITLASCEDFLDRDPQDKISNENLLGDIEGVTIAAVGCYNALVDDYYYRTDLNLISELRGGNLKFVESVSSGYVDRYIDFYSYNLNSENDRNEDHYETLYGILNQANNIVHAIPELSDGTTEEKSQLLGEMYTIRALCHFDLLRLYAQPYNYSANAQHDGIVVVVKTPDVLDMPARSTVYDSYKQIVEDLKAAINLVTDENKHGTTKKFWIGPGIVKAILARVYLYMEDWNNAIEMATEVIEDPNYGLVAGVLLASEWLGNEPSIEDIWVLDNSVQQAENISKYMGYPDIGTEMNCSVTKDLYDLYSVDDLRLNLFVDFYGDTTSYKYHSEGNIESNITVIRLAEIYLVRAEAYARTNQGALARSDLQVIRERANPYAEFVNLSGEELIQEILIEKRRELAFEGHNFFELKRTGSNIKRNDCTATLNHDLDYPDYRYVMPIPYDNIEANRNLVQNEGY